MEINLDSPLIKEFVQKKAGPDAYSIIQSLDEGKVDKDIQEETDIENINKIRSILNRLHYLGIIEYDKEKAKKSNWYTYTWFLRENRIQELLEQRYREELEELEKELEMKKTHVFFECDKGCDKHPFEVAYEYNFKCPECNGEMKEAKENGLEDLEERIKEIKNFFEDD